MERPIRVLHVIGGMNRGGIETWLMNVLRHIDRERFQIDFLVHTRQQCVYDEELLAMGCRIIPGGNPRHPLQYALRFRAALKEYGPYDIVHSHVHCFSGFVLLLARFYGVPARIAHSHTNCLSTRENRFSGRRLYVSTMRMLLYRFATRRLAISRESAADLYGERWKTDSRCTILHYGIDLTRFAIPDARLSVRQQLHIDENAFVIGHVGRMVQVKNHQFLVRVAKALHSFLPNLMVLLVGDGPLRTEIERSAEQEGLGSIFVFAGERSDIPPLLHAMDVFVFPSEYEGFGLVVLEALASGLPCLISDTVPEEAVVIPGMVRQRSLSESPEVWAEDILQLSRTPFPDRSACHSTIQNSPFNIVNSTRRLEEIYHGSRENRSGKAIP